MGGNEESQRREGGRDGVCGVYTGVTSCPFVCGVCVWYVSAVTRAGSHTQPAYTFLRKLPSSLGKHRQGLGGILSSDWLENKAEFSKSEGGGSGGTAPPPPPRVLPRPLLVRIRFLALGI